MIAMVPDVDECDGGTGVDIDTDGDCDDDGILAVDDCDDYDAASQWYQQMVIVMVY